MGPIRKHILGVALLLGLVVLVGSDTRTCASCDAFLKVERSSWIIARTLVGVILPTEARADESDADAANWRQLDEFARACSAQTRRAGIRLWRGEDGRLGANCEIEFRPNENVVFQWRAGEPVTERPDLDAWLAGNRPDLVAPQATSLKRTATTCGDPRHDTKLQVAVLPVALDFPAPIATLKIGDPGIVRVAAGRRTGSEIEIDPAARTDGATALVLNPRLPGDSNLFALLDDGRMCAVYLRSIEGVRR